MARTRPGMLVAVAVLLAACGSTDPVPTLEPAPSLMQDDRDRTETAVAKFVELMAEPELTYRVNGEVRAGSVDGEGRPDVLLRSRWDVKGDDYAGSISIHLRDPKVGGDFAFRVVDDEVLDFDSDRMAWSSEDAPDDRRRPTALRTVTAEEVEPFGVTDDGLVEVRVSRWLHGDPIAEWRTVGIVPGSGLPEQTEVRWHDTRLFLDADGVPQRLTTSWIFSAEGADELVSGTIADEFVGFGMYVANLEPGEFPRETSHNVAGGLLMEVIPEGETATLDVDFLEPDHPMLLGIEGTIFFIRSRDGDANLALDRILQDPDHRVEVPVGEQTLTTYYRTCNGNCAYLDGPHDFCSIETELEAGRTYLLTVQVETPERASCELSDPL